MKQLLLIVGAQASGKSTYLKEMSLKLGIKLRKSKFVNVENNVCIWGKYNMKRRLDPFQYTSGGGNDNVPPDYVWNSVYNCFAIRDCNTVIMEGVVHNWRSGRDRERISTELKLRDESYEYLRGKINRIRELGVEVVLAYLKVSKEVSLQRYIDRYPSKWAESKKRSKTAKKTYDKILYDIIMMSYMVDRVIEIDSECKEEIVLQELMNLI